MSAPHDLSSWRKARVTQTASSFAYSTPECQDPCGNLTFSVGCIVLVEPDGVGVAVATRDGGETFGLLYPYEFKRISE